jgi:hypothetical protein
MDTVRLSLSLSPPPHPPTCEALSLSPPHPPTPPPPHPPTLLPLCAHHAHRGVFDRTMQLHLALHYPFQRARLCIDIILIIIITIIIIIIIIIINHSHTHTTCKYHNLDDFGVLECR